MTPLYMVSWEVLRSRACLGGDRADEPASARLSPLVNEFSHVLLGGGEPQTINPFPPQSYPLNGFATDAATALLMPDEDFSMRPAMRGTLTASPAMRSNWRI